MGLLKNDGSVKVTDPIKDGDMVTIDGVQIEAFAVPGHTKGSAAYLINGVLFMGDSANGKGNGKMRPAIWFLSEDMDLDRTSLKKLAELLKPRAGEIKAIAFSHTGHLNGIGPLLEFAEKN
jgi:glyoxylase-like metal-dependent hydrolase (beta-lactamase superfamily II)